MERTYPANPGAVRVLKRASACASAGERAEIRERLCHGAGAGTGPPIVSNGVELEDEGFVETVADVEIEVKVEQPLGAVAKAGVEAAVVSDEWLVIDDGRYPSQVRRDLIHLLHAGFCSSHFMCRFLFVSAFLLLSR